MPPVLAEFGLSQDVCAQLHNGVKLRYDISLVNVKLENFIELTMSGRYRTRSSKLSSMPRQLKESARVIAGEKMIGIRKRITGRA